MNTVYSKCLKIVKVLRENHIKTLSYSDLKAVIMRYGGSDQRTLSKNPR